MRNTYPFLDWHWIHFTMKPQTCEGGGASTTEPGLEAGCVSSCDQGGWLSAVPGAAAAFIYV